ncbi:MAG: hypothetical protein ABII23_03340 [bacterium]
MKKTYQCYIKGIDSLKKTVTGKRKVWRTDNLVTYCCSLMPAFFIWEKSTKHNGYDPYTGYVATRHVEIIKDTITD